MSRAEGHSDFTEEVSEGNIQVADMKNGHFSLQSPLWNYTTHPAGMALLLYHQTPKNPRETVGSRQSSLV